MGSRWGSCNKYTTALLREKPSSLSSLPNPVLQGGPHDPAAESSPALETRRSMCSGCLCRGKEASFSAQARLATRTEASGSLLRGSSPARPVPASYIHLPRAQGRKDENGNQEAPMGPGCKHSFQLITKWPKVSESCGTPVWSQGHQNGAFAYQILGCGGWQFFFFFFFY